MQVAIMEPESDMVVKRLSVPMGLEELMESLTKEVLRRKPADIYAFASQHFAQLLEIRDQGNYKGSLKKMKKFNSETSKDTLDNSHAKHDSVKVKSATFGAVTKAPKSIGRPKSPAPKAFLTKKNSQANVGPKVSPRTFNNNNKNSRQDRTKMIIEKRRATKKNYEDTKKKLEVNRQPSELESKKIVEISRETPKKDVDQRRRISLQHKRNEGKGDKDKLSSRNSTKNKQDGTVKIGSDERSRRKSETSKTIKKDIKKSNLKDIDEIKALKMEGKASSKINLTDKKNFRSKEICNETISGASLISSNAEISDEVVTQMECQISEVEDTNLVSTALKGDEIHEVKIEVSGDETCREELNEKVISSNEQNADVANEDKSNSESTNIESEDHDKISEGKIDLFIKNIDNLEKGENNALVGSVTKEEDIFAGANENAKFPTIKEENFLLLSDELRDNTEKTKDDDNLLIVGQKRVESDDNQNLALTKDITFTNGDDRKGISKSEDILHHDAAIKIQSLIKGHLARKMFKEKKSGVIDNSCMVIVTTASDVEDGQSQLVEIMNTEGFISDKIENDKQSKPAAFEEKLILTDNKTHLERVNEKTEYINNALNTINAVIKIQALVRGYLTRKSNNTMESLVGDNIAKVEKKISEDVENFPPLSESTAVKMDVSRAASIIQALVRGFLVRRGIRKTVKDNYCRKSGSKSSPKDDSLVANEQESKPLENIDKDMKVQQKDEVILENDSKGIVDDVEVYKTITTDFLGQEHINYDSERYDGSLRNLKQELIEGTKENVDDNIFKNKIENELQKFDSTYAFGDDVEPRANSVEKIANVPNYGDETLAKIQSDWQDHRMNRSFELRDLQKPPECDELPHQRGSPDDAKKAATVIQALFRGYLVRKNFGNVDGISSKKKTFEGKLPTLLEVEGEDSKDCTLNSSDDKKKESGASRTDDQVSIEESSISTDNSNHSSFQKSRTISDEEVYAILKQLDDAAIPTEEPRRKSKTYTRSLTFDDPSVQQTVTNPLTKSMTCALGDEFQRLDIIIDNADESISIESTDGNKSVEDSTDISDITSSIKADVQKLKQALESGIDIHEVSGDKNQEDGNITDITKSIGEDVKQLEKTLSQGTEIKHGESLTRPVSKDSVTSTDSVDTVIFNDIRKKDLSTDNDLKEDSAVNLPKSNEADNEKQNLPYLSAIKEQGDILVDDILDTAKSRLEDSQTGLEKNKSAETEFFDQKSVVPLASEKRQSTTSDELRQLWQDEAATTIQANYRGYRVRRHLERETSKDIKSTEEKVEEEITKYLNQITEPIRKAFSADKSNFDEEEKNENDKSETDSKMEKTPDVIYIPLRDYNGEERSSPLLEKPNILDDVVSENKTPESIEVTIHPTSTLPTDSSVEKVITENMKTSTPGEDKIDLDDASNNEESVYVDKDADEKISACISAIVEPITKKFQPHEEKSAESAEEIKMVMEKSEPEYEYIPLRDYSEEEKDTDHVVIGLNDDITTSMSILKDDTEDGQNNIAEATNENNKNVLEVTEEMVESENNVKNASKVDERNLEHQDANISEESHVIVNSEKSEPTIHTKSYERYGSKEITEYINSIVTPVKETFSPYEQKVQAVVQSTSKDKEPEYEYIPLTDYNIKGSIDDTVLLPKPDTNSGGETKEERENKAFEIKTSSDNQHLTTTTEISFLEKAPQIVHESEVDKNKSEGESGENEKDKIIIGNLHQTEQEKDIDKTNIENRENDIDSVNNEHSTKNESEVVFLNCDDNKSNERADVDDVHIKDSNVDNAKYKSLEETSQNVASISKTDTNDKESNEIQIQSLKSKVENNTILVAEEKLQSLINQNEVSKSDKQTLLSEQLNNNLAELISISTDDNEDIKQEELAQDQVIDERIKKDTANLNDERDEVTLSLSNVEVKSDKIEEVVDTSEQFSDLATEVEDIGNDFKKIEGKEHQLDQMENMSVNKRSNKEDVYDESLESDSIQTRNQLSTEDDLDSENISFKTPVTENIIRVEMKDKDLYENISQVGQSINAGGIKEKTEENEIEEEKHTSIDHKEVKNFGENVNVQLNFKDGILEENLQVLANKANNTDIDSTLENHVAVETKVDTKQEHIVQDNIKNDSTREEFTDDKKHSVGSNVDGSGAVTHSQMKSEILKQNSQILLSEVAPIDQDDTVTLKADNKHDGNADAITDNELQERIDNIESQIEKVFDEISSPLPNKSDANGNSNVDENVPEQNNVKSEKKDEHVDNKSLCPVSVSSKEGVQKDHVEAGDGTSVESITTMHQVISDYNNADSESAANTSEEANNSENKAELKDLTKNSSFTFEPVDESQKDTTIRNEIESNIETNTDSKVIKEDYNSVLIETPVASNDSGDLNNATAQVEDKEQETGECKSIANSDKTQTITDSCDSQQFQSEKSIMDKQSDEIKSTDINTEILSSAKSDNTPETAITDQENVQCHKNGELQDFGKMKPSHDVESPLTVAHTEAKVVEDGQTNFTSSEEGIQAVKMAELNSAPEISHADALDAEANTANNTSKIDENVEGLVIDKNQDKDLEQCNIIGASRDSEMHVEESQSDTNIELDSMQKADEIQPLPEKQSGLNMDHSREKLGQNGQTNLVDTEDTETHDAETIGSTANFETSSAKETLSESNTNTPKTAFFEKTESQITDKNNDDENAENNLIEIDQNKKPQHENGTGKNSEISHKERIDSVSDIMLDNIEKPTISGSKDEVTSVVSDKISIFPEKEASDVAESKDKTIVNELHNIKAIGSSNDSAMPFVDVTDSEPKVVLKNVVAQVADDSMTSKGKSEENVETNIKEKHQNSEIQHEGATDTNTGNVEAKSNIAPDNTHEVDEIQVLHEKEPTLDTADLIDTNSEDGRENLNKMKDPYVATSKVDNTQKTTIGEHVKGQSLIDEDGSENNKANAMEIDQYKELGNSTDFNISEIANTEKNETAPNSQSGNKQESDKIQESFEKGSTLSAVNENGETNLVRVGDPNRAQLNVKAVESNNDSGKTCVEITDSSTETGDTNKTVIAEKREVESRTVDAKDTSEEDEGTSVMQVNQNKELHNDKTTDVSNHTEILPTENVLNVDLGNQVVSGAVDSSPAKEDVDHKKETEKTDEQKDHIREEQVHYETAQNEKTYDSSPTRLSQTVIDEPGNESNNIINESIEDKATSANKNDNISKEPANEAIPSTDSSDLKKSTENIVTAQQDNQTSIADNATAGTGEAKETNSRILQESFEHKNKVDKSVEDQSHAATKEKCDEKVAEPFSEENDKHPFGALGETEQNDKDMRDQISAIDTNSSVEDNEKKINKQKADNFVEPPESINNKDMQDLSKKIEFGNREAMDSDGDLKDKNLELNRQLSPFYLHQDTFLQNAPSTIQEKKFSETFKHSLESEYQHSEDTSEKLLHSSEFHDSLPIKLATESSTDKPQTTQTNGVQCNIGRERSMGTSTVLVHSGELHDNVLPLALQMNQDPAGIEIVTSSNTDHTSDGGGDVVPDAQASAKDVSERLESFGTTRAQSESVNIPNSMDSEKRNNSTIVKKNMESEAATKIQAGFRGYQVRKQLKNKLARDNITNIKRTSRRRSLGRIMENKSQTKKPSDLEEQSATKIQAGIRGFLVRRRQKKNKPNNE